MKLTTEQMDVLKELINIGVGKAAGDINAMTGYRINLFVPDVRVVPAKTVLEEAEQDKDTQLSSVYLGFFGRVSGTAAIIFPPQSAINLVSVIEGEESGEEEDFDGLKIGTLSELGNIVINGVMGSIGNVLKQYINYTTPTYVEESIFSLMTSSQHTANNIIKQSAESVVLLAQTQFTIKEKDIEGEILLLFDWGSFDALVASIDQLLESSIH